MENKSDELLQEISQKLNVMIALNLRSVKDQSFKKDKKRKTGAGDLANYLASFNLSPKDISEIIEIPVQSARTLLTPKRRKN